jgi:hypothetical protein
MREVWQVFREIKWNSRGYKELECEEIKKNVQRILFQKNENFLI